MSKFHVLVSWISNKTITYTHWSILTQLYLTDSVTVKCWNEMSSFDLCTMGWISIYRNGSKPYCKLSIIIFYNIEKCASCFTQNWFIITPWLILKTYASVFEEPERGEQTSSWSPCLSPLNLFKSRDKIVRSIFPSFCKFCCDTILYSALGLQYDKILFL